MQSLLQYRRIGLIEHTRVTNDLEKCAPLERPISTKNVNPAHHGSLDISNKTQRIGSVADDWKGSRNDESNRSQQVLDSGSDHNKSSNEDREFALSTQENVKVLIVDWDDDYDTLNPRNWSVTYRLFLTTLTGLIGFVVGAASSADAAVLPQIAGDFDISNVVASLAVGIYLVGFAFGALFAGPLSETFGRNSVYLSTMTFFMMFIAAAASAPNIGALLAFRFLAGAFGATPLTCAGGSIADLWPSLEKTFAFPLFAIIGFGGPTLGPVIASNVINLGSWRWSEWVILITSAVVLAIVMLFQPETYPPIILKWRAQQRRRKTGQDRFRAQFEVDHTSLSLRLKDALTRPLHFSMEPIVLCLTMYLTVVYIVFFTFLDGYPHIFEAVYETSQGLTNIIFTGIFVGIGLASLLLPWIYKKTQQSFAEDRFVPETRLWFAMLGAPAIPISLFWMAWTDFAHISIWSPILATVLLGYGLICIFISTYMYLIDSYEIYAASALTFITFTRYIIAGGMTVAGVPLYERLGPHIMLTILGGVSLVIAPMPYIFYRHGHSIRRNSKLAVS